LDSVARAERPDVVLIDRELPGADPVAWIASWRAQAPDRPPVLLYSNLRGQAAQVSQELSAGVFTLQKPVRRSTLFAGLRQALTGGAAPTGRTTPAFQFDGTLAARMPMRLLLADDNMVNQKVGAALLKKLGYAADVVGDGRQVMAALEKSNYDIVLLDVQMPEMDGYEAARAICARHGVDGWVRPRLIAMTGNAIQGDREKCLDAGMDDYIAKPVRIDDLVTALKLWAPAAPPL